MKTNWISVAIEERAWSDHVKPYLLSLSQKLDRPVADEQKLIIKGKVLWFGLVGVLVGFVIGAIIL